MLDTINVPRAHGWELIFPKVEHTTILLLNGHSVILIPNFYVSTYPSGFFA